jgi:hypothetical protein
MWVGFRIWEDAAIMYGQQNIKFNITPFFHVSHAVPIQPEWSETGASHHLPAFFSFRKVRGNQEGLELKGNTRLRPLLLMVIC